MRRWETSVATKVYATGFLFNVSFLGFALLVPFLGLHDHLPLWLVGILASIPGIFQLPGRVLSGPLVDRFGERLVLWVTFTFATAAGIVVVFGHWSPILSLVAGQLLIGAARGLFWTAAQAAVTRGTSSPAQTMGLFTSWTKAGALVGTSAAGGLAAVFGMTGAFSVITVLAAMALVISLTLPAPTYEPGAARMSEAIAGLIPASLQPFIIYFGLVAFLCAVPQSLGQSFYAVTLTELGTNQSIASLLTGLMALGMIVAGLLGAPIIRRIGMRPVIVVSTLLTALAIAVTAISSVLVASLAIFSAGFAAGWLNVAFLTAVSSRSREDNRGTNLGVAQVYFVVALMATPIASGWLFHAVGRSAAFVIEALAVLAVAALIIVLWHWQEQSVEQGGMPAKSQSS